LTKTQGQVQNSHVPDERKHRVDHPKQMMQRHRQQGRHSHSHSPSQPPMGSAAGIEIAAGEPHPDARAGMQDIARRDRPGLLHDQSQQYCKKAHTSDDIARSKRLFN
jgi:hypothetical protein